MYSLNFIEKREITLFSFIILVLSSIICYISYKLDDPNISIVTVFTPTLLALIFTAMTNGRQGVKELFVNQTIRKTSLKWLLLSLFGIPLIVSLAILTTLSFDVTKFGFRTTQLMPQIVVIVLIAVGEEYGWRGFLLPKLMKKFSFFYSSLILGFTWGIWHFPAYLIGTGVPKQMDFLVFLMWVMLGTFFMGWIYYYTRSVLTSILIHFSANTAFNYLDILPEFTGSMTPFWILILYLSVLMTVILYFSRKDLMKNFDS